MHLDAFKMREGVRKRIQIKCDLNPPLENYASHAWVEARQIKDVIMMNDLAAKLNERHSTSNIENENISIDDSWKLSKMD